MRFCIFVLEIGATMEKSRRDRVPGDEEGVGERVEDVDDDVVVRHRLDLGAGELPVYQYSLHVLRTN